MFGDGTLLNKRYLLTCRIGGGGMGEVWRADDTLLGRTVAVKVLTHNPASTQRFLNEARAMATLNHPGVVDVYDYGTDGVSFLVMELVDGESLDRRLERSPLTVEATMRLVVEVAEALAAAHERGIVHRDVKPGNLMIRTDGSVVLTDFGIAHSATAGQQLTATGQMLCSAGYCAPEQATANRITPAVDLYALGVVAYECIAGRLPYEGDTPVQIIFKHLNAPVPDLPAEVPPGPRQVVLRALAKKPEERWAGAEEMAAAARTAITDPGWQAPRPRRRRALTATAAVAAALLASAAIAASLQLWPPLSAIQLPILPGGSTSEPPGGRGEHPTTGEQIQPAKQVLTPGGRSPSPTPGVTAGPTTTPTSGPSVPPTSAPTQEPPEEPTTEQPPTQEPPTQEPPTEQPTQEPEPSAEPSHQSLPVETPQPSGT